MVFSSVDNNVVERHSGRFHINVMTFSTLSKAQSYMKLQFSQTFQI